MNLKFIICNDLGNEVIVGRLGNSDSEPGLRLISNDTELENNIIFNKTDISGVKIKYFLGECGPNAYKQYISFIFGK